MAARMLWKGVVLLGVLSSMVFAVSGAPEYFHEVTGALKGDTQVSSMLSETRDASRKDVSETAQQRLRSVTEL